MRLILSPKSLEDLEDIYAFSLETWGTVQADRYRNRVFDALNLLTDHSEIGQLVAGYPLATRLFRIDQYNVFYRIEGDNVRVLRLAHSKRNILPELA